MNPYTANIKKIYGPYKDPRDKRVRVQVHFIDGTRRTLNYARFLMEIYHGRMLDPDEETVDHINGNRFDDFLWNLRIVHRRENSAQRNCNCKLPRSNRK